LAKVDAHVIQPEEYEELPEWTDEMFDQADLHVGGRLVRRGRPPKAKEDLKVSTTLRLDPDVVEHFKAAGPGWQTRINDALRKAAGI
jgi:uncharacterized protein (DUF4415 family)